MKPHSCALVGASRLVQHKHDKANEQSVITSLNMENRELDESRRCKID